ncbi:polysaccharide deacetylase family protein [Gloeomargaritales cyanobacterium VI4D9]|nr:polysaccharide deacetylase family protein [Gloeomargaritales cyanobacterium VI4D9]
MVAQRWPESAGQGDIHRVQRVVHSVLGKDLVRAVYAQHPPVLQVALTWAGQAFPPQQQRRLKRRLGRLVGGGSFGFARIHLRVAQETAQVLWQTEIIAPQRRFAWALPLGLLLAVSGLGWGWHRFHDSHAQEPPESESLAPVEPQPVVPPVPWEWGVRRVMDRQFLPQTLGRKGVRLPAGTAVYAVQIEPGVGGRPAYRFYEAGLGAFSQGFWPASTVKVLPAVAALEWVHTQGFTGQATVELPRMRDRLERIVDRSIRESSNLDYDLTVQLVGLDWLNQKFLTPERGFPTTQLQRGYSGAVNIYASPGLILREGNRQKYIPPRSSQGGEKCPAQGNCANLFEMTEAVRRVVLHGELEPQEQFRISPEDAVRLTESLCRAEPSFFAPGARAALGRTPRICHKPGWVLSRDCVDSGVVLAGTERYLLAVAMPAYRAGDNCQGLSQVAQQVLTALRTAPLGGMTHQPNRGLPLQAQLLSRNGVYEVVVRVTGADRVVVWLDQESLGEQTGVGPEYRWLTRITKGGERLLRVQVWQGDQVVAYQSQKVTLTEPTTACTTPPTPVHNRVIYRGPTHTPRVALSFDDGPDAKQTRRILDILHQEGVPATFFVQGRMVRRSPQLLWRMRAEGHEVANHTTNHPTLTALNDARVYQEIHTTQALVCETAGLRPQYFRPPYGSFDRTTIRLAAELGLSLVIWDVDTRDWQHRNPQRIIQTVQDQARAGSIILMHDIYGSTADALPGVIGTLRAKGLELVTVAQLLATPEPPPKPPKS